MTDLKTEMLEDARWVDAHALYNFKESQNHDALRQSQRAAKNLRAAASLLPAPQPEAVITEEMVAAAMREAWDEICSDTGCHPLDIEQLGRKQLQFTPNHWARFTAMYLTAALKED